MDLVKSAFNLICKVNNNLCLTEKKNKLKIYLTKNVRKKAMIKELSFCQKF